MNPQRKVVWLVASMLLLSLVSVVGADTPTTAFERVIDSYEPARLALTQDTVDGVAERGREIGGVIDELKSGSSAEDVGEEVQKLLPELSRAATALAGSDSLETARDAFYDLSKLLVRWRKAAEGDLPAVAYCPMSKRSWLQPKGEIGNPYHGQSMPRCGEIVDG